MEVSGNDLGGVYLEGGTASLTGLDVTANRRVGIRSEDTDLTLEATRIQRTATDGRERYGDGLVVVAGSAGVTDLRVERSERAAIAVDGATVRVDGCSLIDNRHAALAKNGGVVDWTGDCAVDGDPASEGHVEETELDLP